MAGALIYNDYEKFCRQVAEHILAILKLSLIHKKRCSWSFPAETLLPEYTVISKTIVKTSDGKDVDFFVGDERCVPEDHEESNYRMIKESFREPWLRLRGARIYRPDCSLPPEEAAKAYNKIIHDYLDREGFFDVVLLGMGSDGHTASLFPGFPELKERSSFVLATAGEAPQEPHLRRITMTLPALTAVVTFSSFSGEEMRRDRSWRP